MKDELFTLIPELGLLKDGGLRGKVIAAFADALEMGGWKPDDMAQMPFTLLIKGCPASFLDHTRRVTNTALAIADSLSASWQGEKAMQADRDILLATALLHDVGKLLEYRRDKDGAYVKSASGKLLRHPVSGSGLCMKWGLPDAVVHGVMYHSHEGDNARATLEAVIVNHADFLNFEPLVLKYGKNV